MLNDLGVQLNSVGRLHGGNYHQPGDQDDAECSHREAEQANLPEATPGLRQPLSLQRILACDAEAEYSQYTGEYPEAFHLRLQSRLHPVCIATTVGAWVASIRRREIEAIQPM